MSSLLNEVRSQRPALEEAVREHPRQAFAMALQLAPPANYSVVFGPEFLPSAQVESARATDLIQRNVQTSTRRIACVLPDERSALLIELVAEQISPPHVRPMQQGVGSSQSSAAAALDRWHTVSPKGRHRVDSSRRSPPRPVTPPSQPDLQQRRTVTVLRPRVVVVLATDTAEEDLLLQAYVDAIMRLLTVRFAGAVSVRFTLPDAPVTFSSRSISWLSSAGSLALCIETAQWLSALPAFESGPSTDAELALCNMIEVCPGRCSCHLCRI